MRGFPAGSIGREVLFPDVFGSLFRSKGCLPQSWNFSIGNQYEYVEGAMLRVVLLVVLATTLAQAFPSCGGGEATEVVGWVDAKRIEASNRAFLIVINYVEYEVPGFFYQEVEVGDLVKWDGTTWTIVKKRSTSSRSLP